MDLAKSRARKRVFARFDDTDHQQTPDGTEDNWVDSDDEEAGYFDDGSLETLLDPSLFMQSTGGSGIFTRRHHIQMRPGASAPPRTYANSCQELGMRTQKHSEQDQGLW
jgi:hypothetical protein